MGLILSPASLADSLAINQMAAPITYISPTVAPVADPISLQQVFNTQIINTKIIDTKTTDTSDLLDRLRMGFGMDTLDTSLVTTHFNWYVQRPDYISRTMLRSRQYLYHILGEVEKRGMPTEIALLPMVESAFNPMAYSTSHASGIWQFVPATGKDFGLKQNGWYDGRRDILAATDAALDYLTRLHNQFGTWELALAAYNCGEGCVARAIAKNQAQGLPTDYLSLNLPNETRHYVPKLLAIKQIIADPASAGINLDSIPNQAYFTTVTLNKSIDVSLAAKLANMPVNDFVSLNPAYNRPIVRSDTPTQLLLPVDKADTFSNNLKNYNLPLVSWQAYKARIGERISSIAKKFNVTVAWLKQHNPIHLTHKGKLTSEHTLLVPIKDSVPVAATDNLALADNIPTRNPGKEAPPQAHSQDFDKPVTKTVKVKKGDTIYSIAERYHVSTHDLKRLNKIPHNKLRFGQTLIITSTDGSTANTNNDIHDKTKLNTDSRKQHVRLNTKHYTVKKGDTLHSIATKFDVNINDIQEWNSLKHHSIKPGVKLILKIS